MKEHTKKLEALRNQFNAAAAEGLKTVFTEIFVKHPEITAIGWTQYAPYFNDGDACEFSVHEPCFTTSDLGERSGEDVLSEFDGGETYDPEDGDLHFQETWSDRESEIGKSLQQLYEFLQIAEDTCKDVYGEHAKVIVTRDGVYTEHYDHD